MCNSFHKIDDVEEIDQLVNRLEREFSKEFLALVVLIQSAESIAKIKEFLDQGRLDRIVDFVNQQTKRLGPVVTNAVIQAGNLETKRLEPKAEAWLKRNFRASNVVLTFEAGNPQAAQIIQTQTQSLIRQIKQEQMVVIYNAVTRMLREGKNNRAIAKEIGEVAGLTRFQEDAVQNYKRLLEGRSKEALNRSLRDRRFDRSVGKDLSADQIEKMVAAYRRRYVAYRAKTIARTEAGMALSQAQEEALRQTITNLNIPSYDVEKTWRTTMDGRQRDTHSALNGKKLRLDETFVTTEGNRLRYPRDMLGAASEIINCRCSLTYNFK